jgi:valyl-tRNA synthetase
MAKEKVLQYRITDNEDPIIVEWAQAQTLKTSEIIKFFIEFDIALNGGVRDMAEVLPRKRNKDFMKSYINALISRSGNEQIEAVYDPTVGTVVKKVPASTNQSALMSSVEPRLVEEERIAPVATKQLQEKAVNNSQPSTENKVQTPSMEEMQAEIARLQQQIANNQQEQEPVEEKVTDSITRPPEPKVAEEEQEHKNEDKTTKSAATDSVEVEESEGNDLDKLNSSFNVEDW